MRNTRLRPTGALIAFAISFAAYLMTLAPDLTWANRGADSGDFITAVVTGGIPHPTGYPTYIYLSTLVSWLPLGSIAWRFNLFSALAMSLGVAVLFLWLTRPLETGNRLPILVSSAVASIFFAFAPLVWSQAVITEVYALHLLFVVAILYSLTGKAYPTLRQGLIIGLLFGLGLGNHLTLMLLLPPFLLIHLNKPGARFSIKEWRSLPALTNRRLLVAKILGVLFGSSIYLTLLIRAQSPSPVRWENPVSLERLRALVSADIFQHYVDFSFTPEFLERLSGVIGTVYLQFEWAGWLLALVGLYYGWKHSKSTAAITSWLFVASALFTAGYTTDDSVAYLIPALLCAALWIGYGLRYLIELLKEKQSMAPVLLVALIGLYLVLFFPQSYRKADASQDDRAMRYGNAIMETAPERALIFTDDDEETFSLWYFQHVLKQRPDLVLIVQPFLRYEWYLEVLNETYPQVNWPEADSAFNMRRAVTELNARPFCVTDFASSLPLECQSLP